MNGTIKTALGLAAGLVVCVSAVAADRVKVVNEGGIRDAWMLADGAKLAAPGYPAEFAPRGDNVCIAMGYSIKPDGSTSDFSLLKAWNTSSADKEPVEGFWNAFSQASANALSEWKFKPRPEVTAPQPTYTVATMTFMGKEAMDGAALRDNCKIEDLPDFVQNQKSKRFFASRDKHDLDRMNRDIERAQTQARAAAAAAFNATPRNSR